MLDLMFYLTVIFFFIGFTLGAIWKRDS